MILKDKNKYKFIYESIEELLKESPDEVSLPNLTYNKYGEPVNNDEDDSPYFEDKDAHAFWLAPDGEVILGKAGGIHPMGNKRKGQGTFPGRIWIDEKIISFWEYPDKETFFKIIKGLESKLKEYYPNKRFYFLEDLDWLVEIIDEEDAAYDYTGGPIKKYYTIWDQHGNYKTRLISVKSYLKSAQRSEEEIGKEHVKSPLLKSKHEVPQGFGSKDPKYQEHRAWQMASLTSEGLDFERGQDPKKAMEIGLTKERLIQKIGKISVNSINYEDLLKYEKYFYYIDSKGRRSWDFGNMMKDSLENLKKFYHKLVGIKESQNFERGLDPKESMRIGLKESIINKCQQIYNIIQEDSGEINIYHIICNRWEISILTNEDPYQLSRKYLEKLFKEVDLEKFLVFHSRTMVDNFETSFIWKFKKEYRGLFDVKDVIISSIKESLEFERGKDPKEAIGIGPDGLIKPYSFYELFIKPYKGHPGSLFDPLPKLFKEKDPSKYFLIGGDIKRTTNFKNNMEQSIVVENALKIIENLKPNKCMKDDYYADNGSNLCLYITSIGKIVTIEYDYYIFGDKEAAINLKIWTNKTINLNESISFERGLDPKEAMGIGKKVSDRKFIEKK